MKFRYDSYCGIYCGACDTLIANEKGEVAKLAKEWKRKPEELKCLGCKTTTNAIFCVRCKMRHCAQKKKVDFCFQCDEFPCPRLIAFRNDKSPHHSIVLRNLRIIQEIGVEKWLEDQDKRWRCKSCGDKFSWYDRKCVQCGSELYNCEDEEKELKE
uniref:DUF3795 domain-containing protein n=1 Tax=candidate division WOR-3 bacterium TaxID=2052148 RepID=A0A7C6EAJ4_UNCW3